MSTPDGLNRRDRSATRRQDALVVLSSTSQSIGFVTWDAKPASHVASRSTWLFSAVVAIIGTRLNRASVFTRRANASPSIPGIRTSARMTSGTRACSMSRAARASCAASTKAPSCSSSWAASSRLSWWSSTTMMIRPQRRGWSERPAIIPSTIAHGPRPESRKRIDRTDRARRCATDGSPSRTVDRAGRRGRSRRCGPVGLAGSCSSTTRTGRMCSVCRVSVRL